MKKEPSAPEWLGISALKLGSLYVSRFPEDAAFVSKTSSPPV